MPSRIEYADGSGEGGKEICDWGFQAEEHNF
jgi:hypothetical protein